MVTTSWPVTLWREAEHGDHGIAFPASDQVPDHYVSISVERGLAWCEWLLAPGRTLQSQHRRRPARQWGKRVAAGTAVSKPRASPSPRRCTIDKNWRRIARRELLAASGKLAELDGLAHVWSTLAFGELIILSCC